MFLASIGEMWIAIAEGLEYGWSWLADNFTNALKYTFYIVTSGSVLTGVGYFIKVGLPILKRINNPTLAKLNDLLEKNDINEEKLNVALDTIRQLKEENKPMKEYLILASEVNAKNIFVSEEVKEKFGYLSKSLKEINDETATKLANKIDEAVEDDVLTNEEIIEIAEEIPEVEETLAKTVDDIELELKGD